MTNKSKNANDREDRLKNNLRANLQKRKSQSRARKTEQTPKEDTKDNK
jgi:hypothetical protein